MFKTWLLNLTVVLSGLCAGVVLMLRGRFRPRSRDDDAEEVHNYLSETDPFEVDTEQKEEALRKIRDNGEKNADEPIR